MNNKITEIVLIFWAIVVVASLAFSIYVLSVDGWEHAYSHFFIPAISLMWLLFRWGMYKKMKKHEQQR